ncbi:MAG TPA: hypothetical protein PK079_24485 [Leptospiraceae bacterium]|nr:hypothetical protein [Leptospiraceae bacterium]HMY33127.1 hypothetical protein [Leptospiraceae bacterium]HNA10080.1 hypothetical protein [Leptospiraceae bacterium]HNE56343.1 hypothetical protein [Leptospiraceae bacterium]HNF56645.1 hypothetical protein [Leptospiraceae bacterium]
MRFSLILSLILSINLYSHDYRDDSKKIYKKPIEVITKERREELEKYIADNAEKPSYQISKIKSLLNEYYAQFVEEKRILDVREKAGRYKDRKDNVTDEFKNNSGVIPVNADVNSIRLFISNQKFKNAPSQLARDSDLLYDLHLRLAKLYEKIGDRNNTIESYYSALRYRDYSNTEERYYNPSLLEELSEEEAAQRLAHKKIKDDLEEAKQNLKKAEDNSARIGSLYAKRDLSEAEANVQLSENRSKIDSLRDEVKAKEKEYSDSLLGRFGKYVNDKTSSDSKTIVDLAKQIQELENETKEKSKVDEKMNHFGRGNFVASDTNRNQDYVGYSQLLEFAIKVNPNNAEAILLLADEYKSSAKKRNALDFYLRYIKLSSLPENNGKYPLYDVYRSVAALYTDLKQYVLASNYYEKMLEILNSDKKEDPNFFYQLGDFYSHRLGNFEKGSDYFSKWLTWLDQKRKEEKEKRESDKEFGISLEETTRRLSSEFIASYAISSYKKQMQYPEEEQIYLERAYSAYKEISTLLKDQDASLANVKRDVDLLKRDLLNKSTAESLSMYKEEQEKLEEASFRLKSIKIVYDSLKKTNLLFRMTALEEENRNFKRVKNLYEEIVNIGNENEIANALRNIERIKKIEADGISRKRIVH